MEDLELCGLVVYVAHSNCDRADVVIDEAAVGTEPDELSVVLRRLLQCGVDSVLLHVEVWGEPTELSDGLGERVPSLRQEVNQRGGAIAEGVDRGSDRFAVLRQPRDELLQTVD